MNSGIRDRPALVSDRSLLSFHKLFQLSDLALEPVYDFRTVVKLLLGMLGMLRLSVRCLTDYQTIAVTDLMMGGLVVGFALAAMMMSIGIVFHGGKLATIK